MEKGESFSFQYIDSKRPTYVMLSHIPLETGLITGDELVFTDVAALKNFHS